MEIIRKTIGQMINEIAEKYPNNDALIHTDIGTRYNYSLLLWEINRAAKGMIKIGLQKGDRVALWAPNITEWIISQIALARIGASFQLCTGKAIRFSCCDKRRTFRSSARVPTKGFSQST